MASSAVSCPVPKEILDQILEELYYTCRLEKRRTSVYASVCSAWKTFFEARHFKRLVLTLPRVADFGMVVVGDKRKLVKHIQLEIFVRPSTPSEGFGLLIYAIGTLFDSLSTWDKSAVVGSQGLVLELAARHWVPINKEFESIFVPNPAYSLSSLPEVKVVTTLLFSQNGFVVLQPSVDALHQILRSLPALQKMRYEQRASLVYPAPVGPVPVYEMLLESLPESLTELAILEEVDDGFSLLYRTRYSELFRPSLGLSMARASRQLQHFSTSFAIDARYFLQPFWPEASNVSTDISDEWSWSKLETLALTTRLLASPKQSAEDVNCLLEAASLAVRRMPKLLTMEIWCGDGMKHACFFRYSYHSDSRTASLTWKGTWTVDITERTASSWRETVRQRTAVGAEIRIEPLVFRTPLMTEAVALYLDLRNRAATTRALSFANRWPQP